MTRLLVSTIGAGLALLLAAGPALAHDSHTVERGDTLSHIAAEHGTTWPELFRLNRSIIDDPDLIFPGQVLVLAIADVETSSTNVSTEVPATGHVTSPYGMRTHPITGVYKLHSGTDYSYGDGNAYAARAGTVTGASWMGGYGRMVTIDHGSAVTRYAHLASFNVSMGDWVNTGTVVGRIGSSGYATGAHLHFEVLIGGEFVNPSSWL